ncbi:MAG: hypothetical protein WDN04_16050 [Rhodospirillales bacterium]
MAHGFTTPLDRDAVIAKFRALTAGIAQPTRLDEIVQRVLNLDAEPNTAALIGLLADPVAPPFG